MNWSDQTLQKGTFKGGKITNVEAKWILAKLNVNNEINRTVFTHKNIVTLKDYKIFKENRSLVG